MKKIGVLLLTACRTLYCWIFPFLSLFGIGYVYMRIQHYAQTHLLDTVAIFSDSIMVVYFVVLGIAWWMIFRGKPALKKWAIAANLVLIFTYVPAIVTGNWRGVLRDELEWWPVILIGTFGIIIFSIPYHGWRHRTPVPTN
jgi:hypothetical protein